MAWISRNVLRVRHIAVALATRLAAQILDGDQVFVAALVRDAVPVPLGLRIEAVPRVQTVVDGEEEAGLQGAAIVVHFPYEIRCLGHTEPAPQFRVVIS